MPVEHPKQRLNIFLMKTGVAVDAAVEIDDAAVMSYPILAGLPFTGTVWVRPSVPAPPRWVKFVQSGVEQSLPVLLNQNVAALVVLTASDRTFAIAFGSGRHWIADSKIERRFGMKVTLNSVHPDRVRSVDREEFDTITKKTRSQTSASATLESFGLDVQRDLVRSVTGEPENLLFADHVTGADNLTINVAVDFAGLGTKCDEALAYYASDKYKERYAWIDNFLRVSDPIKIDSLDAELVKRLNADELENIFLSPPTLLDIQEHQGFKYPRQRAGFHSDLRIETLLALPSAASAISVDTLKQWRIREYTISDSSPARTFSVYDAIVFDFSQGGSLYVLSQGEWFEIDQDYVAQVQAEIASIPDHASLTLPDAQVGELEGPYNARAASISAGSLALLDKKLVRYGGGYSSIEVCDLLSLNRDFVHVKAKTKSSTLSHLFQQGLVSAQAFRDTNYRAAAKAICPTSHQYIFDGEPVISHHSITYAIMTTATGAVRDALPFFSKQSLSNAAKALLAMNYQVRLAKIAVV